MAVLAPRGRQQASTPVALELCSVPGTTLPRIAAEVRRCV